MTDFHVVPNGSIEGPENQQACAPPSRPMDLRLLGPFALADRESGIPVQVPARKAKALLAILAVSPRLTASRARLASLLWSGSAEEQARQSLRQLLSSLRRSLQPFSAILVYDENNVRLDASCVRIDVHGLLSIAADADDADLSRVTAAYRGPFGSDLELGEADFDEWLRAERERICNAAVPVMDRLVRGLARAGKHQEALDQATALLSIHPLREETHRLIIAQEAIVSGRASAMQRYETFRILLRDELAVRPEPATIKLIDNLRNLPAAAASGSVNRSNDIRDDRPDVGDNSEVVVAKAALPLAWQGSRQGYWRGWRGIAAAVVVAGIGLAIWGAAQYGLAARGDATAYVGESDGRVSVAVLPFEASSGDDTLKKLSASLNNETTLAISRSNRLSLVDVPTVNGTAASNLTTLGRQLRARYLVKTTVAESAGIVRADVTLVDSASGISIWSAPVAVSDRPPVKFAREFYGYILSEVALHRARVLSQVDKDSTEAMLWRAEAAQIHTRIGAENLEAFDLYKAVLARDPDQLFALLGLSDYFILRVARNQSDARAADIAKAGELLARAKMQAPNSSDVAFKEGMLNKLQGQFAQASMDFDRTMRLDPTHWNAAAQFAHVKIFMGQFEDAFSLMQRVGQYLLPDMRAAETAYIAGETALVAGNCDEAVRYLEMAISGNPTVGRIHALQAAALQVSGRAAEARQAAERARALSPAYTPEIMAQRGGASASPRYVEARNAFVAAFRNARAASVSN